MYESGFDCGGSNCTIDQSNSGGTAGSNLNLIRATANGSGGLSGTFYGNSSGTIQTQSFSGFTYTVASSGRTIISGTGVSPLLLYLTGSNRGWELGSDNGVGSGGLEPQSATTVSGTYAFGGINPPVPKSIGEGVASFTSGNLNVSQDQNDPSGGSQSGTLTGVYTVDGTGFGKVPSSGSSCTITSGSTTDCQFMFYVVSSGRIIGMDGGNSPTVQPADQ